MPVETGQYLSDLNANFPNTTDAASQGDDHLRLIKSVLKNTFPAVAGPVTGSHTELNAAVASTNNGASKLADAGAHFNTNDTDGLTNPAAGEVDVECGANTVVKFKSDKSADFQGTVTAAGPIKGPGTLPIGGTIIWWGNTLPDASWGTYAWCNGDTYLRSNTALFSIFGTTYGNGDGATTANLPDLRARVPVGADQMGGAAYTGRIPQFTASVMGAAFGDAQHTLTDAEVPATELTISSYTPGTIPLNQGSIVRQGNTGDNLDGGPVGHGTIQPTVTLPDFHPTGNVNGGGEAHDNIQPSLVCNWIVRIA